MLNTTFRKLKEAHACKNKFEIHAAYHGGIDKYGWDTPIPLSELPGIVGLDAAIWAFRATVEPAENILIEFACQCANRALPIFEAKYPDDKRPLLAIEAARVCITDKSISARDAAYAACAADYAAEVKWQTDLFIKLVS